MDTPHLDKVLRLAAGGMPSARKRPSGLRLGTPYRVSWGAVQVGDVVEFGPELWKVIPTSSYPNHKVPGSESDFPPGGPTSADDPGSTPDPEDNAIAAAGPPMQQKPKQSSQQQQLPMPSSAGGPAALGMKPPSGGQPPVPGQSAPGAAGQGGMPTSHLYLQDVLHPSQYDELALPSNYIVTVVPVLP
jgi:hypothetical protein